MIRLLGAIVAPMRQNTSRIAELAATASTRASVSNQRPADRGRSASRGRKEAESTKGEGMVWKGVDAIYGHSRRS